MYHSSTKRTKSKRVFLFFAEEGLKKCRDKEAKKLLKFLDMNMRLIV